MQAGSSPLARNWIVAAWFSAIRRKKTRKERSILRLHGELLRLHFVAWIIAEPPKILQHLQEKGFIMAGQDESPHVAPSLDSFF
jgi:hypothetical protein